VKVTWLVCVMSYIASSEKQKPSEAFQASAGPRHAQATALVKQLLSLGGKSVVLPFHAHDCELIVEGEFATPTTVSLKVGEGVRSAPGTSAWRSGLRWPRAFTAPSLEARGHSVTFKASA